MTVSTPRLAFNCRHRFPSGFVLDASFEIGDGVTALFGPSGGGKSTILNILSGVLRPDAGVIRLKENILFDRDRHIDLPPERRSIGIVFQDHLLFPHKTIRVNLQFGKRRRPSRAIELDRVVEILDLAGLLDRFPGSLSGGQRQRVALGRAILRGPELLLMDEPLSAIDEELKHRILTYLGRAISEWRIPTLFVSHDQADVRRLAEEIVVIEAGKIVATGPTGETLDRALISGIPFQSGPINLLRVDHVARMENHFEGMVSGQRVRLPGDDVQGESVLIQFTPGDVMLGRGELGVVSARNRLLGVVREIIDSRGRIFVAIDAGQFIWAEVTPEAALSLQLRAGAEVVCLIKTTSMRIVD